MRKERSGAYLDAEPLKRPKSPSGGPGKLGRPVMMTAEVTVGGEGGILQAVIRFAGVGAVGRATGVGRVWWVRPTNSQK